MPDNIHINALEGLARGVKKATDVVKKTLGAAGTNVLIEHELYPYHQLTNDGATIIKAIELSDPLEKQGLTLLKEAVDRSNTNSGDGSTTTTILLNAILQEGLKLGISTLEIKESLDETLPIIEQAIRDQTKAIAIDEIPMVALIAGENQELANTLGDIYKHIGKEGIIHLEGSGTYATSYELVEGVRLTGTGYLSPFMVYDDEAQKDGQEVKRAIYHTPKILVTKRKITHINELNPLLQTLIQKGEKALVIFADDMDSNVARLIIDLQKDPKRLINVLIVKAPVLWKQYVYEDFAKITGATTVEDATGVNFKNLKLEHLGTCGTLIATKDETTVIGIADITDHLESIRTDEALPTEDKQIRLAYLKTKTAILKLGAKSETELSYLKLKAEDAIHSCRLALQSGIVAGGGIALHHASKYLPPTIGGTIMREALNTPVCQIIENAGQACSSVMLDGDYVMGFNAKTKQIVDMFEAGIVDASEVVIQSVRNSLGIASTILTTSSMISLPLKEKQDFKPAFPL